MKNENDQWEAQLVRQAIKDDESLSGVAAKIHVTVKDGTVTLDGRVRSEQESNLAVNTAAAFEPVENVHNRLKVTHQRMA